MAADEVLNLFDSIWFGSSSCFSTMTKTTTTPTSKTNPSEDFDHDQEEQIFPEDLMMIQESLSSQDHDHHLSFSPFPNHLNVRSQSEHLLEYSSSKGSFFSDSQFSPSSVLNLNMPKLQTIISGKEVRDFSEEEGSNYSSTTTEKQDEDHKVAVVAAVNKKVKKRMRRRKLGASSKSLSDLEFEELKGFMDLGFVFTEEECRNSNLISIIPGLQRFAEKKQSDVIGPNNRGKDHDQGSSVSRPYLSEAWDVLDIKRKKEKSPLMNWKLTETGSEIDMKDQLKFWAHSVASTVR
ncbi:uncharacterized protein LOC133817352 [Humulus lupulus]|uniref:uncharacterized protein LOC133817352 n=1 Tax=Humulus lupulus TaxID=3486 RepID=UPI002B404664|nr:uncharacterized protein LOC133817352 [Humulus lupulus]